MGHHVIVDVIIRGKLAETEDRACVFASYDKPGYLGIRREHQIQIVYIPLAQLEYLIDEARRAQPATVSHPEGTQ